LNGVSQFEIHRPVLRDEVLRLLSALSGGTIVDGTVGLGGHAEALLEAAEDIRLVGIDRDEAALAHARQRLAPFEDRICLIHGDYRDIGSHLEVAGIDSVDGLLLDIGVSSLQLDDPQRGFSLRSNGPLDMRMDRSCGRPASDWIAAAGETEIADALREYGEERYSRRIARAIVRARGREPIETATALRRIVHGAVPGKYFAQAIDPATRTFQAVRIAVNDELAGLRRGLEAGFDALAPGGILVVLSFHSLEDRIVKNFLRERAAACVCPHDFPECVCDKRVEAEILTRKPIVPGTDEIAENPRARSAKLRAAKKVV
jgi:16S rRNA (cytosine1402-N4)-methyltransferase